MPQEEHDTVVAERDAAQAQAALLQGDLGEAEDEIESLEKDLEATQSELTTVEEERDKSQSDLEASQSRVSSLQSQVSSLSSDYKAASDELAEIKEVYPLGEFSSVTELRDWLALNDVSERPSATNAEGLYLKALDIQEDAMNDGYIISASINYAPAEDMFYIACLAVIDGYVWGWGPESEDVVSFSDATDLLKLR